MNAENLHTKREMDRLGRKIKNFSWGFRVFSIIIYLLFIGYKIGIGSGNLIANILLLVASVAYFIITIYFIRQEQLTLEQKKADKFSKLAYKWAKRAATALSAVLSVMGILVAGDHPTVISIMLAIFMPVSLVLQIIFDLVLYWLGKQIARFKVVVAQDVQYIRENAGRFLLDAAKDAMKFKSKKIEQEYAEQYPDDPVFGNDKQLDASLVTVLENGKSSDMGGVFTPRMGEIVEFGSEDLSIFDRLDVQPRAQLTDGQKTKNIAKKAATIVGNLFGGLFSHKQAVATAEKVAITVDDDDNGKI